MGRISVNGLGKAYKQYEGRWARLAEWLPFSGAPRHRLKWVLQDISFEVSPGEAVGIVGINGAGKSTLLKMITGTTQPTAGSVNVTGRVAALLELGMGFHPDFTGRQNAIMAGQLLGYSVEEIAREHPKLSGKNYKFSAQKLRPDPRLRLARYDTADRVSRQGRDPGHLRSRHSA